MNQVPSASSQEIPRLWTWRAASSAKGGTVQKGKETDAAVDTAGEVSIQTNEKPEESLQKGCALLEMGAHIHSNSWPSLAKKRQCCTEYADTVLCAT